MVPKQMRIMWSGYISGVLFFVFSLSGTLLSEEISSELYDRVMAGEIIVSEAENENGVGGVKVTFTVRGSKEDIWDTITDYEHFEEIFGSIEMEILHEDELGARVNATLYNYEYVLYHQYVQHGERMRWHRESGDLKVVTGSWNILSTDDPGVQLVLYENYVDAGSRIGNWLVEWGRENRGVDTAEKMRRHVMKLAAAR